MNEREAYFILNLLPEIGAIRVNQLLRYFDGPVEVLRASVEELSRVSGISRRLADIIVRWRDNCDPEEEMRFAHKAGVTVICRQDPEYPSLLQEIPAPPLALYVRGTLEALSSPERALAIVGTRGPTNYGVNMARHLAASAVYSGWRVVSGLARGIDTVAHRAVVEADGSTVAVLGGGLAQIYPRENIDLARDICRKGALLSEMPMRMKPNRLSFPLRNRLIAGLSLGTVVVEAGTRSGALITAAQALEQNRRVFAVPGRVDSPQARGCHSLLKDGATLVERFEDIDTEFDFGIPFPGDRVGDGAEREADSPSLPGSESRSVSRKTAESMNLSDIEQRVLNLIGREEVHIDELISASGEPAHVILATLSGLEMRHLIQQLPGKRVATG